MAYNFEKFISKGSGYKFTGIKKRKGLISVSRSLAEIIGGERVAVFLDKENSAIMLKATDENNFSYSTKRKKDGSIGFSINEKEMPLGRYYF